ncbi:hypothetical protein [Amycolatopsis sp. lyj-108]|uniref:hypothetical protein n=1 Tax=Amycolatopsis sp. lyj-108 TaxID=2789286 RepID=UPI00397C94CE
MFWHALYRIGRSGQGWQGPVESIEITRVIDGGRSGAFVLEVALRAGAEYRQRVVKIGAAEEMAAEYGNYRRLLVPYPAAVCAPIQEATQGALDIGSKRDGEIEAVVYTHVAEYAGRPQAAVPTLEDLVRTALGDSASVSAVRRVIGDLFAHMATPFHNRREFFSSRSLRDLNPTLGPDLVLSAGTVPGEPIYAEDVLEVSLGHGEFVSGQELRIADSGGCEVRIETSGQGKDAVLSGRVIRSRFSEQRRTLDGAFASLERKEGAVIADGVRTADPAAGLRPALTDPRFGRVRGIVHGDLNARNVMCVESRPVLIDFARTAEDRPVLSDAAWLEVSLMRDVFAGLPYADLVRIQRSLAFATRARAVATDVAEFDRIVEGFFEDQALVAFRILYEVRLASQHLYPGDTAWLDYAAVLHLSAYRTVKWSAHPEHALRATHAVAAVATEWLAAENPFSHGDRLTELFSRVAPAIDLARPGAASLMAGLLAAVDARHPGLAAPEVDELRDRFTRTCYADRARALIVRLSREHGEFPLAADHEDSAVVTGGPGAGKSRLLLELAYWRAIDIAGPGPGSGPLRFPLLLSAAELLADPEGPRLDVPREALVLGAVHLLLDGLDEVPDAGYERIAEWARSLLTLFPRVRLSVAVRDGGRAAEAFELPVHRLALWDEDDITWFLSRRPIPMTVRRELASTLAETHRADGGAPQGLVAMLAEAAMKEGSSASIGALYERYFAGDLTEAETTALASVAAMAVDTAEPVRPGFELGGLLAHGILEASPRGVRFLRLAERDYFAARALSGDLAEDRARTFAWRDICVLGARLPSTPDAVVDLMVRSVISADPRFAARMLALRPVLALGHVRDWRASLADAGAGSHTHRSVAEALLLTGIPSARQAISDVLLDPGTPAAAQLEILGALELSATRAGPTWAYAVWARHVLGGVLASGEHPAETVLAAIAVIGAARIRGLEMLLGELLQTGDPRVALAADGLLRRFQVVVPPRLGEVRDELTASGLRDVEARLPTMSGSREIRKANETRVRLLERTSSQAELITRRFSYGIAYDVGDLLSGFSFEPPSLDAVRLLTELPESEAVLSAHQLLSGGPQARDALVLPVLATSPLHLLLIAAGAAASPAAVDHVERLVIALAPVVEADRIEGLAALCHAVVRADPRRGFALTRSSARILRDRDLAARLYWPWSTMMAHTSPAPDELDRLLADGVDGAIEELALYAPSWDGTCPPVPPLSVAAREAVLERRDDVVDWVLAVAAAKLTNALPEVIEIAGNRKLATATETFSTGRHGIVGIAPHARVLAALGGFARETGEYADAHRVLVGFDTAGLHPTVDAGRSTGLAFLGDWEPLLRAAKGDGGPLDTAARQAILHWAPGPCTPAESHDPREIAARLLRSAAEPGTTPERRALLEELTYEAERKHGKLLPRPC